MKTDSRLIEISGTLTIIKIYEYFTEYFTGKIICTIEIERL